MTGADVAITREQLLQVYWRARGRIAPTLTYAQNIYENVLNRNVTSETVWLDLGCGHQLLPEWRFSEEQNLVNRSRAIFGLDYDLPSLTQHRTIKSRVQGDISHLPFPGETFDLVTANMVVEHLDNPEIQFKEVARVLKSGGRFVFHTPNAHGYFALFRRMIPSTINNRLVALLDGRKSGDVFPVHYRANTLTKVKALADASDLFVAEEKLLVTDAVFSVVPPLMLIELVWLRALMTKSLRSLRTNIIATLSKK
jgi:SAM-dependent methyltransferase